MYIERKTEVQERCGEREICDSQEFDARVEQGVGLTSV